MIGGRSRLFDRFGRVQADPVEVEDVFGEDRAAADQRAEVEPEEGDDRDQRVAEHVADPHLPLAQTLGAGGADVVLVHRVEHVGAQHAAVEADERIARVIQGRTR